MSVDHYENFPVASILLPTSVRQDVIHIYRFARAADDIADEGDQTASLRRAELARFRQALTIISENPATRHLGDADLDAIFVPLGRTIIRHRLPLTLFMDLLSAFEQDTQVHRYRDEKSLNDYCRRSANPVGRLLLHLFKKTDAESLRQSDDICTALQRINFLQDVSIDWDKQRVYLPEQDMQAAEVTEAHISQKICDTAWRTLMSQQVNHCRALMQAGAPLGRRLKGRLGLEIRLVVAGGLRILEKIESVDFDVFNHRPTLDRADWLRIIWRAI